MTRPPDPTAVVYLVGLTGGIGSGKSTVAARLAARGAVVVDADRIAREVVAPGQPALDEIVERFGPDVLLSDGSLDRAALAAIVFSDDDARLALNDITHPRIRAGVAAAVDAAAHADDPDDPSVVVLDVPLLVESGLYEDHDALVVVVADPAVRTRRLVEQRGMDPGDVAARMAVQLSDDEREVDATHVIHNDGDLEALEARVEAVWQELVAATRRPGPGERST